MIDTACIIDGEPPEPPDQPILSRPKSREFVICEGGTGVMLVGTIYPPLVLMRLTGLLTPIYLANLATWFGYQTVSLLLVLQWFERRRKVVQYEWLSKK